MGSFNIPVGSGGAVCVTVPNFVKNIFADCRHRSWLVCVVGVVSWGRRCRTCVKCARLQQQTAPPLPRRSTTWSRYRHARPSSCRPPAQWWFPANWSAWLRGTPVHSTALEILQTTHRPPHSRSCRLDSGNSSLWSSDRSVYFVTVSCWSNSRCSSELWHCWLGGKETIQFRKPAIWKVNLKGEGSVSALMQVTQAG